ncbi:hypothetical protein [Virgibacillus halodenitrificans]|uniref:hypothetical protein n=1 Tax=Virgibacillus halodenitrificans TaxID=1482 RepID=UPI000EF4A2F3|nr:hypothetical protein [Virgibacillus halodenitrificans]
MENPNIKVCHYMKTNNMEGFEFETNRTLGLGEEQLEADYFRLELHDTGNKYVMVAYPEEFFVSEDVTPLFDNLSMIEQECREQLKSNNVYDNSQDFVEFLAEEK